MATIYTTIEEFIKYKYGDKDNKITRFITKYVSELPQNFAKLVTENGLVLLPDSSYKAEPFIKKYTLHILHMPEDLKAEFDKNYNVSVLVSE